MAQFLSYIRNKLYHNTTWGPFSIGVYILWDPDRIWTPTMVKILWGGSIFYYRI